MPRNTHMLACLILCLRWHLASSYILMMRYFYTYFKRITRMSCPMPIAICIPFCTWILALGKQTVTAKKNFLATICISKNVKKFDHYLRKSFCLTTAFFPLNRFQNKEAVRIIWATVLQGSCISSLLMTWPLGCIVQIFWILMIILEYIFPDFVLLDKVEWNSL